jgi:hypothetical protein
MFLVPHDMFFLPLQQPKLFVCASARSFLTFVLNRVGWGAEGCTLFVDNVWWTVLYCHSYKFHSISCYSFVDANLCKMVLSLYSATETAECYCDWMTSESIAYMKWTTMNEWMKMGRRLLKFLFFYSWWLRKISEILWISVKECWCSVGFDAKTQDYVNVIIFAVGNSNLKCKGSWTNWVEQ